MTKAITVRLPADLDEKLTERAKKEDISKNQAIKAAVRKWLRDKANDAGQEMITKNERKRNHR